MNSLYMILEFVPKHLSDIFISAIIKSAFHIYSIRVVKNKRRSIEKLLHSFQVKYYS